MGRHRAPAARHRGPAAHVGRASVLAVALGIGAAVAGGTAVANAEGSGGDGSSGSPAKSTASKSGSSPSGSNGTTTHTPAASSSPTTTKAATSTPSARELAGLAKRVTEALRPGGPGTHSAADANARAKTPARGRTDTTNRGSASESASPRKPDPAPAALPDPAPAALPDPAPATKPDLVANVVSKTLTTPSTATPPTAIKPAPAPSAPPAALVLSALQLVRREIERAGLASPTPAQPEAHPVAAATAAPSPTDDAPTAYGDIGKWMLQSNGQISNYGGQPYGGKTLLEPVNVIIVDPRSKTPEESAARLNNAMFRSGFPAQPIHSTGFRGTIDDVTYSQQPTGPLLGYSDNSFLLPNDHGRIFGPDPVQTSTGYVWSGAFSTEQLGLYGLLLTHTYVSSNAARTALATRLVTSGQATYGGMVPLNNAYNTDTTTTGDHDGYAVVLVLR